MRARQAGTGSRRIRLTAGLVALCCLVGQLSGLAHMLLVQHVTCPEHGELVHSGAVAHTDVTDLAAVSDATPATGLVSSGDATAEEPAGHGHDHCLAAAHGRGHVGLGGAAAGALAPSPALAGLPTDAAPHLAHDALYRLAPKTSPPC